MRKAKFHIEEVPLKDIKPNPNNPRIIRDEQYHQLVESIKNFPEMLFIRPIVVNGDKTVLGGNQRYRACIDAGRKTAPIINAEKLTPEQQQEFIIKDNVGGGEWNWEMLANQWDAEILKGWGLDVWVPQNLDLDNYITEKPAGDEAGKKLVLVFSEEDFEQVTAKLDEQDGTREETIKKLLGL